MTAKIGFVRAAAGDAVRARRKPRAARARRRRAHRFGPVADRAFVEQALAADRAERDGLAARGRLTALALRAALVGIEEQLLVGKLPAGVTTSYAVTGPPPPGSSRSYASRAHADLETLLDSTALTRNGLPNPLLPPSRSARRTPACT